MYTFCDSKSIHACLPVLEEGGGAYIMYRAVRKSFHGVVNSTVSRLMKVCTATVHFIVLLGVGWIISFDITGFFTKRFIISITSECYCN